MPEEQQPESTSPAPAKGLAPRRRGRRGGRGRRRPAPAVPVSGQAEQADSSPKHIEPPIRLREEMPVRPAPSKPKFQPPVSAPRAAISEGSAISEAVEEVRQVVESLENALEQMEEVLRLVELAERQKSDDEQEIESLRRGLRRIQPPRGRPEERSQPRD